MLKLFMAGDRNGDRLDLSSSFEWGISRLGRFGAIWSEFGVEICSAVAFKAYLVGGSIRDLVMGRHPSDYDITTNAHPQQVTALFDKTLPVGRWWLCITWRSLREAASQ